MKHYKGYEIMTTQVTAGYHYIVFKGSEKISESKTIYESERQAEICGTWKVDSLEQLEMVKKAEVIIDRLSKELMLTELEVNETLNQVICSSDEYASLWIPAMKSEFSVTNQDECSVLFQYAHLNYDLPANYNPHA